MSVRVCVSSTFRVETVTVGCGPGAGVLVTTGRRGAGNVPDCVVLFDLLQAP